VIRHSIQFTFIHTITAGTADRPRRAARSFIRRTKIHAMPRKKKDLISRLAAIPIPDVQKLVSIGFLPARRGAARRTGCHLRAM